MFSEYLTTRLSTQQVTVRYCRARHVSVITLTLFLNVLTKTVVLEWKINIIKFFCFHPLFLVWCCFTFQDKYLGQKPKLHPSELSVLYLRLKKPFWMHWLVGNVPTVISWHLPLTALFCMSVLCLLKSRCGQSCDDFWRNAITALRTSPQASQTLFPLQR